MNNACPRQVRGHGHAGSGGNTEVVNAELLQTVPVLAGGQEGWH